MNLTVGPLPPAVYWRRRAVVLGGLLVVILLWVYSCSDSSTSASNGKSKGPVAAQSARTPQTHLSPSVPANGTQGPLSPSVAPSADISPATPLSSSAPATAPASVCTDKDVKVFPVISPTSSTTTRLQYGGTFDIKLEIKNTSTRTCTRDVGSVAEEIYIMRGKTKIWSSDDCGSAPFKAHDERSFKPGVLIYADVKWSSFAITPHDCKRGTSPAAVGTYQLFARVGSKVSEPVTFKIET